MDFQLLFVDEEFCMLESATLNERKAQYHGATNHHQPHHKWQTNKSYDHNISLR